MHVKLAFPVEVFRRHRQPERNVDVLRRLDGVEEQEACIYWSVPREEAERLPKVTHEQFVYRFRDDTLWAEYFIHFAESAKAAALAQLPQWFYGQALDGYGEGRDTSLGAILDPEHCKLPQLLADLADVDISWGPVERAVDAIEMTTQ
jgi:hypothetical protein